tara:strand:+ start:2824 stop:3051 length:228 start_codon:yes stop_codon:yes gene_type:complete
MFQVQVKLNNNTIHDNKYKSLKEIAEILGMTYQQVADINSGRFCPKFINKKFIFQPEITINRVEDTDFFTKTIIN